jgi:glucokinase
MAVEKWRPRLTVWETAVSGTLAPVGNVLAVDVGGSKMAAALVDGGGVILRRAQTATPSTNDPELVRDALYAAVSTVVEGGRTADTVTAIGVGSAGPVDVEAGTVSPVNIPAWRGYPILDALRELLPGRAAALAGDGHCMALGEHLFGGGPPSRALLGMVVSTGVGGGFVLDGRILAGPTGNAGHIGHIVVDFDGPPCPCGSRGCVEVLASGPNMVRWAAERGCRAADGRQLAALARAGDPVAIAAYRRAATAVAAGIVSATALVDLDDVVVGGGVAGAGDVLFVPLRAALADLAGLDFVRRVRVRPSTLGATAGLLGAAGLVLPEPVPV